ncbi:MAG: DNA-binding protein [Candidatus Methanomethylicota archaeon]|uniref:DNA-binding protein DRJ20_01180 n=1 Tax=Thermoproteota archaeon TaxID=2056631 RepID=A0A497EXM2_9CREN|nr:MAG: DNA-binding protein [Candidatus Verstraetearchaeota archaeon]RLE55904.1 MAG: DNA-binding protein [Candidatus Verstraetearchaeota archaeon]
MSEVSDEELEAIRQRKLLELQKKIMEAKKREEMEAEKQAILRVILTPKARSRLMNLKMVRPEFAAQLELQLIQLARAGRLPVPLTDEQLKAILIQLTSSKRTTRIMFKRKP